MIIGTPFKKIFTNIDDRIETETQNFFRFLYAELQAASFQIPHPIIIIIIVITIIIYVKL